MKMVKIAFVVTGDVPVVCLLVDAIIQRSSRPPFTAKARFEYGWGEHVLHLISPISSGRSINCGVRNLCLSSVWEKSVPLSQNTASGLIGRATELSSLATTVIAALTGAMYLAGWAHRNALLIEFGLSGEHFSPSLQSTLAQGYLIVLFAAIPTALALYLTWTFARKWGRLARFYAYFWIGMMLLAGASQAGIMFGMWNASTVRGAVESGCEELCYVYVTANRRVIGKLIVEDAQHMAIYTGNRTALLKTSDLRAVIAYRPAMRL